MTKCLGEKNIEEAQKQKKVLEDVQRAEEGERKRNNEKFKPKVSDTFMNCLQMLSNIMMK